MGEVSFSVLIANYNNAQYIKQCYESLCDQSYSHFEIIIVDDCSTDDSYQIIKDMAANDERIRYFKNDVNRGCGFTKNRCVALAKGDICGFVDPDDTITPDAIAIMIKTHEDNPLATVVWSNFIYADSNLNPINVHKNQQAEITSPDFFNFKGLISAFSTFKKSFYEHTEGINPYLLRAVDQDLYLKLSEQGGGLYIDEDLYYYRQHDGGISSLTNRNKAYFWHWVVLLDAAKRRNMNVEDLFYENFERKLNSPTFAKVRVMENSRWIKLGKRLGLLKGL